PKIVSKETSSKSIDSKTITIQHAELISKWIDRLEITDKIKNSYEFKLILRGSRDGFSPMKDSNEILGGYNPIMWTSNIIVGVTRDSFIFSFKNKENIENCILSRVKYENYAIENHPLLGPSFGDGDLRLCGKYWGRCNSSRIYDNFIRVTGDTFSIEEYEIFQIIKID
ncbi:hypothetical protein C1646_758699, partial [Rhizophagus diaphanus]